MKRKADSPTEGGEAEASSKKSKTIGDVSPCFRSGLFDKAVLDSYTQEYAASSPYKHAVIHSLIDDKLLRSVRDEIRQNVSFTPKETDIYKIHQSGDLANLDGLDVDSLSRLPSLLALRDAIYSESFRSYISSITGCGPLSGRKTDMAVNVYTPGCYLLCHDDVIGSRRVSYILYLTDPDQPWKPHWGGSLRLFPVQKLESKSGEVAKTPLPDPVKSIPPAWNQLSFFAVQPGESFHDVEEVYHAESAEQLEKDGGRVRMAISGWFHIPQIGEDGYIEGEEERNAKNSGLMQLQGNPAQYDKPQPCPLKVVAPQANHQDDFEADDLEFLLRFISPVYLTPDMLEQIRAYFDSTWSIALSNILSPDFAGRLRDYITQEEKQPLPEECAVIEKKTSWKVAKPPHKHRYLYQSRSDHGRLSKTRETTPITDLLDILLPSRQFRIWLQLATGCTIESCDAIARRFRRGQDYTLATGYDGKPRLEVNLGITPTPGWSDANDGEGEEDAELSNEDDDSGEPNHKKDMADGNGKVKKTVVKEKKLGNGAKTKNAIEEDEEKTDDEQGQDGDKGKGLERTSQQREVGQDHEDEDKENVEAKVEKTAETKGTDKKGKAKVGAEEKATAEDMGEVGGHEVYMAGDDDADEDAAVYRSSGDDDNILFFQAAAWNRLTLVLRDSDTLRFVKYVSKRAQGDRWDISAVLEVEEELDGAEAEAGPSSPALGDSDVETRPRLSSEGSDSE